MKSSQDETRSGSTISISLNFSLKVTSWSSPSTVNTLFPPKSLYMAVDPDASIITGVDSVKLSQTIFPTDLYTNKSFTKQRPNFNSNFGNS